MPISITHKILRNTGWNFVARIIHIPVSIGLIPFIIGRVGPEWYGVWVALFALVDYFSLLDLGMGAATIKYVAEYHASGNLRKIGDVVLSTCLFNLIFLPPLLLCHVFSDEILAVFKIAPKDFVDVRLIFDGVLLNFAASQVSGVFRNTLIGLQRMHVSNFCDITSLAAYAASTVIVLGSGAGLTAMVVVLFYIRCGIIAMQVLCLLQAVPILKHYPGRIDMALLREFFRYGLKLQMSSLAGFLNFQMDKLLIGHFLRMEFVAFYEMGSKLALVVRYIPSMMLSPLIPAAAELSVSRDSDRLEELHRRGTKYLALASAPLMAFMVALGPAVMQVWLGDQSTPQAVLALQMLSIGYFFNIVAGAAHSIGRGIGVLKYELQATGLITALNLLLSISLIVRFGFVGALIGTGAAMTVGNLYYVVRFHRFLKAGGSDFFWASIGKPLVCAGVAGGAMITFLRALGIDTGFASMERSVAFMCLCGSAVGFLVLFLATLLALKFFTRADVEMLGQFRTAIRMIKC